MGAMQHAARAGRRACVGLLGLLAVVVWWERRIELPIQRPAFSLNNFDDFAYHYPTFLYAFRELREGRFPMWNPYQHCGSPFFATAQHLLLYPLNILYLALPTSSAMKGTAILHIFLAFVFTFALGRTLGLCVAAAAVSGLLFAFCKLVAWHILYPHLLYGMVWIPAQFALTRRLITKQPRTRPALVLGACLAAQYLGGYPLFVLLSVYLALAYLLWRMALHGRSPIPRPLNAVLALAAAFAVAIALSAPQLLPALELSQLSQRSSLTLDQLWSNSSWLDLARSLLNTLLPNQDARFIATPLVAIAGLMLAFFAPFHRLHRREIIFCSIVALVSFLLSLGRVTPLYALYFHLPTGNIFRLPERFAILTSLALAILAGYGADFLWRGEVPARKAAVFFLAGAIGISFAATLALGYGSSTLQNADKALGVGLAARLTLLRIHVLVAAGWVGVYLVITDSLRRLFVALTLPGLVYITLYLTYLNHVALPETHPDLHSMPTELVEFLRSHQGYDRTFITAPLPWGRPVPSKSGMMHGVYAVADRQNVYPDRVQQYWQLMNTWVDPREASTILGMPVASAVPQGEFGITSQSPNLQLLDFMSTRFIVEARDSFGFQKGEPSPRYPVLYANQDIRVYENPKALPRAYVVGRAEVIMRPEDVLGRLINPAFDARNAVILEEQPGQLSSEPFFRPAQFLSYAPSEVVVLADAPQAGFLVLTDQYYPGWQAEVDGKPASLYRANYLFRAVPIEAGNHRVVFRFVPRSFYAGLVIASTGLLAAGAAVVWSVNARRAPSGPAPA